MMDNSFFEYRNHTGALSDSDSEIIDSSFSQSFVPKTPAKKNQTVYVPESDDSTGDESEKENASTNISKSVARRNSVKLHHVVLSSDDDKSSRGSFQRQSESSNKEVIISSDDEVDQQVSPEIIPKRRPLVKPSPRSSDSFIGRKKKKHMILLDSESDNSFIKEHARKKKCLKDTPVKIDSVQKNIIRNIQNMSIQNDSIVSENDNEQSDQDESQNSDENGESDDETESHESENEVSDSDHKNNDRSHKSGNENKQDDKNKDPSHKQSDLSDENYTSSNEVSDSDNQDYKNKHNDKKHSDQSNAIEPFINEDNFTEQNDVETSRNKLSNDLNENADETSSSGKKDSVASDDGLEEERMMMSRATRMSIMGVIPKENDSDDSDYIESDDTAQSSRASSTGNLYMGHDIEAQTPEIPAKADDRDTSRITCSPITSPSHDLTNEINNSANKNDEINNSLNKNDAKVTNVNLYSPEVCNLKNKVLKKVKEEAKMYKENVIDDDVTIIDKEPEIIALSSDDEVEVKDDKAPNIKKSPSVKKSPRSKEEGTALNNDIKKYLAPPSYPNQGIVYVKKHVRENELSKLNGLREDLQNVRYLMENMDVETLPDRGAKLIERLEALERDVQKQANKVANMVVEPDMPTQEQMSRDGFAPGDKGLSWDDIQKASNAVQPRMFGKQAMATHNAERSLILDRLRDLYESLASRPSEESLAKQPASVKSELMEHQLHALAWLKWRETQKPSGGILADDMGLGKTITMISLIAADKEGSIDNDEDDDERGPRSARGGTLVVCPATLVQQWANEVGKHCKSHAISVCLHHGSSRATQPHRLAANDLVITTFNIMQRESVSGVLSRIRWRRVILDEAHVVRNYKSATSQGVCSLHGRRRWALTGTPLHNKDLDLFALLKFLRCTPFDDLTMWKKWIDNKSLGGSERLNTIMSCVMLRRTKLQLQEKGQLKCLPERSAHEVSVTLQQEEMNVYQKVLVFSKTLFAQFLHQRAERAAGTQGLVQPKKDSEYAKMHKRMIALQGAKPVKSHEILVLLLRLRQVCCHCGLIAAMLDHDNNAELAEDAGSEDLLAELNKLTLEDNNSSRRRSGGKQDEEEEEEQAGEGTTAAEAIKSVLSSNNPVFNLQRQSSKIKAVMECLDKNVFKNKGEKAVVVSQWTSVLSLVERELKAARIRSVTLSGEVPVSARAPLINALNDPKSDVRVMLLSLCAGGVGLNLCGANHLLLLDPHWNPQLEEQAQDRIYRVGQRKPVHIYKFMCVDTVEQSIRQLQKAKLEMAENVLTGAKNTNGKLSVEELKILFNMGPQDGS